MPTGLLSAPLESTLNLVFAYAREHGHEQITVEHLLLLLLEDVDVSEVMNACGVDLDSLRKDLSEHLAHELQTPTAGNPVPALAFQRILQRAVFHVQSGGKPPVTSLNVFVALFSEKQSRAVALLHAQGMNRIDAVNYITHGLTKAAGGIAQDDSS